MKNRVTAKIKKLDTELVQKDNSKKLLSNTNDGNNVTKTVKVKDFLSKNLKKKRNVIYRRWKK